ncbi:hypothetical protein AB4455_06175 [Vibrio sp. 10N.261.46.E12]|uniref:hypothetical protein n=1 Tax=unclassified Vibrio TaxID=2614977 RepID=UPI00097556AE|nr:MULTISPECIES: hypothetical protein [unclassified Vibrio]OMO34498.1 hypothetical protein BH584_12410 [Vibrio sp. 10N.261.45.E1]PMJ20138.1 hypothetical protein BCU27_20205 [Vibrio sp. 10N.286.45.B6]PML95750.1 hypothetical protein BCT66_22850 [Vibrio sp. 10N.261.49.E11]PMM70907.1 hypothetical protein BCT48_09115 [Vibrio sp. 10N.261.46.F12]PMM83209.1 hypothetical protein BCT46_12915 [Vibrio sp. 10N.261.46.E8]
MKFTGIATIDTPEREKVFLGIVTERMLSEGHLIRTAGTQSQCEPFISAATAPVIEADDSRKPGSIPMEVFLPYKTNGELVTNNRTVFNIAELKAIQSGQALKIISRFVSKQPGSVNYPAEWDAYVPGLLGKSLDDKSKLMICWAPKSEFDSNERMNDCAGDLGVAVRMAYAHGINVFNTAVPAHKHRLLKWISGDKR